MKLTDVLLIGLSIAFLIIGIDQSISYGFNNSYWAFMLALVPFFVLNYRRNRKATPPSPAQKKSKKN